jgi:protein TonB
MLTPNQLLNASMQDILFQNRNQDYGAYQIRKAYNKHLYIAMAMMLFICGLFFFLLGGSSQVAIPKNPDWTDGGHQLVKPPVLHPPNVPKISAPAVPKFQTEIFTEPLIVNEEEIDKPVPELKRLEKAAIGLITSAGDVYNNIVVPPIQEEKGNIAGKATTPPTVVVPEPPTIYTKVEKVASFPGGVNEWVRYLQKYLHIPDAAIDEINKETVVVQFVIDENGSISDVVAVNNPGYGLAEEAVRIIKAGPRWIPAEQNGKKVKYRHSQPITFSVQ